jgi:hypothetical protein
MKQPLYLNCKILHRTVALRRCDSCKNKHPDARINLAVAVYAIDSLPWLVVSHPAAVRGGNAVPVDGGNAVPVDCNCTSHAATGPPNDAKMNTVCK